MSDIKISPYQISIPEQELSDLKTRLSLTRWPEKETVDDWSQGVPLDKIQDLCRYWRDVYDWRKCEAWLNSKGQFKARIDDEEIHFLHIKSPHETALPLMLLHGWPGSVLEFRHVIDRLTDPTAFGGRAEDAFHLVIPSMPGFGFSSRPKTTGNDFKGIASLYARLMEALEYPRWAAQGGDFGADICGSLASHDPPKSLVAIHINCLFLDAHAELASTKDPAADEKLALDKQIAFETDENGYFKQQATRPQTVGYGLSDSPSGQAAWIYEKLHNWAQHDGDLETVLARDEILDNIMLYWLTNTGASSARLYWEEKADDMAVPISIPVAVLQSPGENVFAPRSWAERYYSNIVCWSQAECGGHFAAWEAPEKFVQEICMGLKSVR